MPKKGEAKKTAAKKDAKPTKPKTIHPAPSTLSQTELLNRTLALMEPENEIARKAGKDFMDSLVAAVQEAIASFKAVNIGGLVKITPRFYESTTREVLKEFGNPEAGKVNKKFPQAVKVRANPLKATKDAVPSPQKAKKVLGK